MKKTIIILSICLFATILVLLLCVRDINQYAKMAVGSSTEKKLLIINPGQTVNETATNLYEIGVIQNPIKFKILSRLKGLDKKLKIGEYHLSSSMSPSQILDKIINGKTVLYRITIPEGYNLRQISSKIEKSGIGTVESFYRAASDPEFTRQLGIDADTFEGYLFPDTYFFPKNTTPKMIISTMLARFRAIFTKEWKHQASKLGFSVHQIVTLASIIERETGASFERPIISSVFHNRLQKKMRLESDPTVIYSIENFNGNITKKHLQTRTPYNTYKIRGLPPGPIANPGKKALEAALFPEKTKYLYFVSKRDTTHKFSTNISEHNRAVRKYQILRK